MTAQLQYDVLVIGSGAAGLGVALSLANQYRIAVICKDELLSSSSQNAQGGIAAVIHAKDSYQSHIDDTLAVGDGLCDKAVVEYVVTQANHALEWLVKQGVQFSMTGNRYHLTREGGHSHPRIIHNADKTGSAIVKTLSEQVLDHPNIDCLTQHTAFELIMQNNRCWGVHCLDNRTEKMKTILANFTVLATGGASRVYLHTTNPNHTSGDGIALAAFAGAKITNMEFQQFHPTCFYNPKGNAFLISEVMRGEGAKLVLPNGERFMQRFDARGELAPRDIVSRAIDHEMRAKKLTHVYLDIRHQPADKIKNLFPTINALCQAQGIDICRDLIPVVPAAHYTCGGVVTDQNAQTTLAGLFAVGEVACTGLHGANRMASNSLLECLVFARSAAEKIKKEIKPTNRAEILKTPHYNGLRDYSIEVSQLTEALRRCAWDHLGIVRNNLGILTAENQLKKIAEKFYAFFALARLDKSLIELRHLIHVAQLIAASAKQRHESRGVHYNTDFPKKTKTAKKM